jgi:hypothetical protein
MSTVPPAANGAISVMGLVGKLFAVAGTTLTSPTTKVAQEIKAVSFIVLSPCLFKFDKP